MTYKEAVRGSEKKEWKLALEQELDFIERNSTLIQNVLLLGKDAFPCKLVLNRKPVEKGLFARYEMLLGTKGYVQMEGVYCDETSAPVIKFYVFLPLVIMFISLGGPIHHADIFTAFLNGDVDSERFLG